MGIVYLIIFAVLAALVMKYKNDVKVEAQRAGFAIAQKQIADTALDAERDSQREMKKLIALRPIRQKAWVKKQEERKVQDVAQKKIDPVYRAWADQPVPQYVVDRLFLDADIDDDVRVGADDRKSGAAVQTGGAQTKNLFGPAKDVGTRFGGLRLGPAKRN